MNSQDLTLLLMGIAIVVLLIIVIVFGVIKMTGKKKSVRKTSISKASKNAPLKDTRRTTKKASQNDFRQVTKSIAGNNPEATAEVIKRWLKEE